MEGRREAHVYLSRWSSPLSRAPRIQHRHTEASENMELN
jgi:hypothetical protein